MLERYIGLSNETPYGMMKFLQLSKDFQLRSKLLTVQNSYNLLCRNFDSRLAECCHHERISLLAYSPMAMGILSGKYHSSYDCGPPEARMNLFKGRYSEGESRYKLQSPKVKLAVKVCRWFLWCGTPLPSTAYRNISFSIFRNTRRLLRSMEFLQQP